MSLRLKQHWHEILLFTAVIAVAAVLRLYRLDQLPPGLHFDEAFDALHAERVLAGVERPIIFPDNLTEEPMSIYGAAVVFGLFGSSPWSVRLASALVGTMNVAALYFLARQLFHGSETRRIASAALAALVLAILYWHVNFSRLGMEPIYLPAVLTLSFGFLWRGFRRQEQTDDRRKAENQHLVGGSQTPLERAGQSSWVRWLDFALAGVFLGATQYTYKAALFVPLIVVAFLATEIVLNRPFIAGHWRGLVIFLVVAVLVFAPLGLYFVAHPQQFLERPTSVTSTLNAASLADSAVRVAGMFFLRGDDNPRSNLPGRPALDPFLALAFIVGIIVCFAASTSREGRHLQNTSSRFLLLWLLVMVTPTVFTDFAPHFGRSVGATPAIALIVAAGLLGMTDWVRSRGRRMVSVSFYGLLAIGMLTSAYSSIHEYFGEWSLDPGLYESFDVGYLSLANKLRDRPSNESIYLSPVDQDHFTIQYGMAGRQARSFDGRRVLVLPPTTNPATYGIVTREDHRSLERLAKIFSNAQVVDAMSDFTGAPYASLLRVDGAARLVPQKQVYAQLGETIRLIGYDMARDASSVSLTVYWESIAETELDYTVFVHLVGALNPATQSPIWAQDDARAGHGAYSTWRWRAGEVIVDDYRLDLPRNMPRGEYEIEAGMYILNTGARVPVTDANGAPMENDRVLFETISLP